METSLQDIFNFSDHAKAELKNWFIIYSKYFQVLNKVTSWWNFFSSKQLPTACFLKLFQNMHRSFIPKMEMTFFAHFCICHGPF